MVYAENIVSDTAHIAPKLKKSLESVLPSHHVNVSTDNYSMVVTLWGYNPSNNIAMNSPSYMKFIMHLTDNMGRHADLEKVAFEKLILNHELKAAGIKYRKISAKSILNAADKLVKWVEKNRLNIGDVEAVRRP